MPSTSSTLLATEPAATLLVRVHAELAADFKADLPTRFGRAPGRLDVMGGIAHCSGAISLSAPLDCAAAVAQQQRDDDQLQVFSFDQFDAHKPFTLRVPLRTLATLDAGTLRRDFADPGRRWAAAIVGSLHALHGAGLIDLLDASVRGLNVAVMSTVPAGAGLGAETAMAAAAMIDFVDHFGLGAKLDAAPAAKLSAGMMNDVVAAPGETIGSLASFVGDRGTLTRAICQPVTLQPPLRLPDGVIVFGIDSGVRAVDSDRRNAVTRCASFMGHAIILRQMRELGTAAGITLVGDPMRGYLANLDPDDYKKLFRPGVPEQITGQTFLDRHGPLEQLDPQHTYLVQHATDHHVLEARRVKRFVESIEAAAALPPGPRRKLQLDRAGHLMYASHQSYTMDAMLGADECDWLVAAVRSREHDGFYGARITAEGCGGTVAVLADDTDRMRGAVDEILTSYRAHTGRDPKAFLGSSEGAWRAGTATI